MRVKVALGLQLALLWVYLSPLSAIGSQQGPVLPLVGPQEALKVMPPTLVHGKVQVQG